MKNNDKIKKVFEIMSFYDDARWSRTENYNLINFVSEDLDNDSKLLTHWISYITDRQTPYQRIWDIGGFVFSDLVREIKNKKNIDILNPQKEESFFVKNGEDGYKFRSISIPQGKSFEIIKNYKGVKENQPVEFISRFYPSDYLSILYTVVFLQKYDYSLTKFIVSFYEKYVNDPVFIKKLLFALSKITYLNVGQAKREHLEKFNENIEEAEKRAKEFSELLENKAEFEKEYEEFKKNEIYKQKRAWCSLRDYLKSQEFSWYFKEALKEQSLEKEAVDFLFDEKQLFQLELPGDVWNNNLKFKECIFSGTEYENDTRDLNKIIRKICDDNTFIKGYPEQFDVTFNFVPKMCESNNCDICPLGKLNEGKEESFDKVCVKVKNKFCPVLLSSAMFKMECDPEKCKLLKVFK